MSAKVGVNRMKKINDYTTKSNKLLGRIGARTDSILNENMSLETIMFVEELLQRMNTKNYLKTEAEEFLKNKLSNKRVRCVITMHIVKIFREVNKKNREEVGVEVWRLIKYASQDGSQGPLSVVPNSRSSHLSSVTVKLNDRLHR